MNWFIHFKHRKKYSGILLLWIFITIFSLQVYGQCPVINNSFQAGEVLTYDVYFNYGIIDKKAGISILSVDNSKHNDPNGYTVKLIANSSGLAKTFYELSDTIYSGLTKTLEPVFYTKHAHEGGDYTKEHIEYHYEQDKVNIHARRERNSKLRYDTIISSPKCIYDMISVIYYARTLDYTQMKKGDAADCLIFSGRKKMDMKIVFNGTESIKANDGNTYDCIVLTLAVNGKAFEDGKEAMKIFMTNDKNRIPVRINSKLKIGSTYVLLKNIKGNKHPFTDV